jgi:hypothetical protein
VNGRLVIVKAKKTLAMVQNVVVLYIDAGGNKYGNIHALKLLMQNGC